MFSIKSLYLTIPKNIGFGLQCHQIMKKCSSEMHQYELADPVEAKRFLFLVNSVVVNRKRNGPPFPKTKTKILDMF